VKYSTTQTHGLRSSYAPVPRGVISAHIRLLRSFSTLGAALWRIYDGLDHKAVSALNVLHPKWEAPRFFDAHMIGAAMLSILLFPTIAGSLLARAGPSEQNSGSHAENTIGIHG
jgi:hypothetical protein